MVGAIRLWQIANIGVVVVEVEKRPPPLFDLYPNDENVKRLGKVPVPAWVHVLSLGRKVRGKHSMEHIALKTNFLPFLKLFQHF